MYQAVLTTALLVVLAACLHGQASARTPSTLGTFLRAFTHGHVQQLNAVLRQTLIRLAERAPLLGEGRGSDRVVFVDVDSTHRQVYGYAKQGAAVGRLKRCTLCWSPP